MARVGARGSPPRRSRRCCAPRPSGCSRCTDAIIVETAGLDADVKRAAKGNPLVKQLTTMPGVGVFSALFVQAEIGSIDRFRSSHELTAYAGLVPTTRSSA